jgi:hypothetical protein
MVIRQHDRRFVADRTMRAALWRFVAQLQAQLTINTPRLVLAMAALTPQLDSSRNAHAFGKSSSSAVRG